MSTISIYVDAQHLYHAARSAGDALGLHYAKPDYENILVEALKAGGAELGCEWQTLDVVRQRIYSASRNRTNAFGNALERLGYDVQSYILRSDTDNFDWDTKIACDVMTDLLDVNDHLNHVAVIVSGDGDFAPVLEASRSAFGVRGLAMGYEGSMSSRFDRVVPLTGGTLYVNT